MENLTLPSGFVRRPDQRPWSIPESIFNHMKQTHWDVFMSSGGGVVLYLKPSDATRTLIGSVTIRPLSTSTQLEIEDGKKQADVFIPGEDLESCLCLDRRYERIRVEEKDEQHHDDTQAPSGEQPGDKG